MSWVGLHAAPSLIRQGPRVGLMRGRGPLVMLLILLVAAWSTAASGLGVVGEVDPAGADTVVVAGAIGRVLDDLDDDGVADSNDTCPGTIPMTAVDSSGCSSVQPDVDGDGVSDALDDEPFDAGRGARTNRSAPLPMWPTAPRTTLHPDAGWTASAAGDLDRDGDRDVVLARSDGVIIAFENVDGVIAGDQPMGSLDLTGSVHQLQTLDVDGDGWLDVVVGLTSGVLLVWSFASGIPGFSPKVLLDVLDVSFVGWGDVDGDQRPDVCLHRDRDLEVWTNGGGFLQRAIWSDDAGVSAWASCAFTRIGADRSLALVRSDRDLEVRTITNGTIDDPSNYNVSTFSGPYGASLFQLGDVDGDGEVDVLHHDWTRMHALVSNGSTILDEANRSITSHSGLSTHHGGRLLDADGDGRDDFTTVGVGRLLTHHNGSWSAVWNRTGTRDTILPLPVDLDGDGAEDLLFANTAGGIEIWYAPAIDADADGVHDPVDLCPGSTDSTDPVGCDRAQRDADADGITDALDPCPGTVFNATVDASGCASGQPDRDQDGVPDSVDEVPFDPRIGPAPTRGWDLRGPTAEIHATFRGHVMAVDHSGDHGPGLLVVQGLANGSNTLRTIDLDTGDRLTELEVIPDEFLLSAYDLDGDGTRDLQFQSGLRRVDAGSVQRTSWRATPDFWTLMPDVNGDGSPDLFGWPVGDTPQIVSGEGGLYETVDVGGSQPIASLCSVGTTGGQAWAACPDFTVSDTSAVLLLHDLDTAGVPRTISSADVPVLFTADALHWVDWDGDGHLELVYSDLVDDIAIVQGLEGPDSPTVEVVHTSLSGMLAVRDMNADGLADVIDRRGVLRQREDGSLERTSFPAVWGSTIDPRLAFADIEGDGDDDLIVMSGDFVIVYRNAAPDSDNDGVVDEDDVCPVTVRSGVAVDGSGCTAHQRDPDGDGAIAPDDPRPHDASRWIAPTGGTSAYDWARTPHDALDVGRVNDLAWHHRYGTLEVAIVGQAGVEVRTVTNGVMGPFPSWLSPTITQTRTAAWADVHGDGEPDIAIGVYLGPDVVYNRTSIGFDTRADQISQPLTDTVAIHACDLDTDGAHELVMARNGRHGVLAQLVHGRTLSWSSGWTGALDAVCAPTPQAANRVALLALDAELYTLSAFDEGRTGWTAHGQVLGGRQVRITDLEADGIEDVLVAGDRGVHRLLPAGGFEPIVSGMSVRSMTTGDLDGDGEEELVLGLTSGGVSIVSLQDGGQTTIWRSASTDEALTVSLIDQDADGDLDLAVGWRESGVHLYRNAFHAAGAGLAPLPSDSTSEPLPAPGLAAVLTVVLLAALLRRTPPRRARVTTAK